MKTKTIVQVAAAWLFSTFSFQFSAFAQGSLTPPPGAPSPTMTSLSQVMTTLNQNEPRTPISSAPYNITKPGSYYLTTNLTVADGDAIDISANGVTLDLNGFTISSTGTYGTAIWLVGNEASGVIGNTDITISNGHLTGGVTYTNGTGMYGGSGFVNGISYNPTGGTPYNVRVTGVSVSGCQNYGIYLGMVLGNSTVVESCTVNTVGGEGIVASSVSHSTANQCGNTAIVADTASDCYGNCTGAGHGLLANYAANNCYGNSVSGHGIYVQGSANSCYGNSASGIGLRVGYANNCYGQSYDGTGIIASIANSCYGFTDTGNNGDGLDATTANNCIGFCGPGGGTGLAVTIAIGCDGYSNGSTGLVAFIANSCFGTGKPAYIVTHPYNMP